MECLAFLLFLFIPSLPLRNIVQIISVFLVTPPASPNWLLVSFQFDKNPTNSCRSFASGKWISGMNIWNRKNPSMFVIFMLIASPQQTFKRGLGLIGDKDLICSVGLSDFGVLSIEPLHPSNRNVTLYPIPQRERGNQNPNSRSKFWH